MAARSELLSIQILSTGINGISFVHLVLIRRGGGDHLAICMFGPRLQDSPKPGKEKQFSIFHFPFEINAEEMEFF